MTPQKSSNLSNLSRAESLGWSLSDQVLSQRLIDSSCLFYTSSDCRTMGDGITSNGGKGRLNHHETRPIDTALGRRELRTKAMKKGAEVTEETEITKTVRS